jgi:arylsulfatase A-like enzyme
MPPDELTFAHLFKGADYATGMFGKYHTGYIPYQSPRKMGFDIYRGNNGGMDHHSRFDRWGEGSWYHDETLVEEEEGYSTELITEHALDFIDLHRKEPFLLYVADWMVHFPWQGPDDPADFDKGVDNSSLERKYGSVVDRKRAYREMVEAMDGSVGRITGHLAELGLAENTFFFFASDNGGHELICDNRPLNGAKGSLLEGGHRVPAVASWPGRIREGVETDETVMLLDLFPTILDIASIPRPQNRQLDGVSLLPMMKGEDKLSDRFLFWREGDQLAVREGAWKLVVHRSGRGLYNLDDDLGETRDLSSMYPERVAAMRKEFEAWCRDVDADRRASEGKVDVGKQSAKVSQARLESTS